MSSMDTTDVRFHMFPSFFRIILEPRHDLNKLAIPKKFITDHGNDLMDVVTLKIRTGKTWNVELLKENGRVWFRDGWNEFVTYYSICHGHSLLFTYKGMSQFNVFIFDMTACEIEYRLDPPEPEVPRTASSSEGNGMVALIEQYIRTFGTVTHKHILKINSYQFEIPCFSVIMTPPYVTYMFRLNVPSKFAVEYLIRAQRSCILQNATGDTWPVRREGDRPYVKLSGGWKMFALDNKLRVGDICVFELINVAECLFKVEIIRCSSQASGVGDVAGPSSPTN